jgi:hypothetical protein
MLTGRTMALRHPAHLASDAAAFLLLLAPLGLIVLSGRERRLPSGGAPRSTCRCRRCHATPSSASGAPSPPISSRSGSPSVYGSVAAHHRRAERILIPALDVPAEHPVNPDRRG